MALGFGSVREVWYATLADPNTKYRFLIRDDAFSKSGAVFGRTVRLGDPVNVGPGSSWRSTAWEGGALQHDFDINDPARFYQGSADVWSHPGRIRMWPGWAHIHKDATRKFDSFVFGSGNDGPAIGNTKLYVGERDYYYVHAAPSSGFLAYSYAPDTNTWTQLPTTPTGLSTKGYTAICPATDDGSSSAYIYFGTVGGLWLWNEVSTTWFQDTGASYAVNNDSMVAFRDALYYCSGKRLIKRTPSASLGVVGTHTIVKNHGSAYVTQGLTVWNNRLWYGINFQGNKAMLGTSDGVTAQTVIEFPEEFFVNRVVAHYGSLYIFGGKPQATAGSAAHPAAIAVVWKYTGSSLTKLWESDDEDHNAVTDGKPHIVTCAATFGSLLVWGNPGFGGTVSERAGLICYDADQDAIFDGPNIPIDLSGWTDGLAITGLHSWDNTLVASYHDFHSYVPNGAAGVDWPNGICYLRWPNKIRSKNYRLAATFLGRSVENGMQTRIEHVLSARYRGDHSVYAETKTWLSGKIAVRIATAGSVLRIYAVTDERNNYLVKTITFDSTQTGWRTVTFPLKNPGYYFTYPFGGGQGYTADSANNGKYLQSQQFQYRFELENTDVGHHDSTSTPEIDAFEVGWMVAPTKRRQWHLRHVLQDGQLGLDGTANSLTTAQAQADELELLWAQNLPFRFWGPYAAAVNPNSLDSTNCVEVIPSVESYNNQEYRLDTGGSEVAQETALTLIENVVA